jgi:hypothetical protein
MSPIHCVPWVAGERGKPRPLATRRPRSGMETAHDVDTEAAGVRLARKPPKQPALLPSIAEKAVPGPAVRPDVIHQRHSQSRRLEPASCRLQIRRVSLGAARDEGLSAAWIRRSVLAKHSINILPASADLIKSDNVRTIGGHPPQSR